MIGGSHICDVVWQGGCLRNVLSHQKSKCATLKSAGDRLQNEVEIIFFHQTLKET